MTDIPMTTLDIGELAEQGYELTSGPEGLGRNSAQAFGGDVLIKQIEGGYYVYVQNNY